MSPTRRRRRPSPSMTPRPRSRPSPRRAPTTASRQNRSDSGPAMKDRTILRTGVVGSVVAAVCCFTPVLVILLGAVGLSAWLGWLDYVLFPALALFLGITAYGLWRRQQTTASGQPPEIGRASWRERWVQYGEHWVG